jgi:hypothetical protein
MTTLIASVFELCLTVRHYECPGKLWGIEPECDRLAAGLR